MQQQQQQHAQYYDKLLYHLNKTFLMNMKAQQLFLDLNKQTRTIRFKSIKNIYNTLTQGKADQVIYQKDKAQLISNHVFNQKFTQRTCWRIIQKLVTKVAYYLSHENALKVIAPSIIKVMSFLRNANQKVNNRASFVMFFQEVLDSIITQNNLLEQKIYDLLIKRGYIYSIDQFYRLNRFEGSHDDYICPNQPSTTELKETQQYSLQVAGKSIQTSSFILSKRSKSRFGGFSSKKMGFQNKTKTNLQQQGNIPQESEAYAQANSSQSLIEEQQLKIEEFNRLSHNIHQQVEKTVDQLLNNNNFQQYISHNHSQDHVSSLHDSNSQSFKPTLIKQLLKNLKNRNFKANQKILVINSNQIVKAKQQQRKNSSQNLLKKKKRYKQTSNVQKNRTSIALALNKGMKQRIFKNEHLADIEDLIIDNLDKLQSGMNSVDFTSTPLNKNRNLVNKRNIYFRSNARQHTEIFPIHKDQKSAVPLRRASNIQFLNNAFNFQGRSMNKNSYKQIRRISNLAPQHMSQISSNLTIQGASQQDKFELIERYINNSHKKQSKLPKTSQMSSQSKCISRFASEVKQPPLKQKRFINHQKGKTEEFNPTILLTITAQKYNKCITQQPQNIADLKLNQLDVLASIKQATNTATTNKNSLNSQMKKTKEIQYYHYRKFDIYDRKRRKLL